MNRDDPKKCAPCCLPGQPDTGAQVQALARAFKAMGDPTRVAILAMLRDCGDSLCACEIEASFELSQPTISHHLRQLRQAGLVTSERRGSWMHYRLAPEGVDTIESFARALASDRALAG